VRHLLHRHLQHLNNTKDNNHKTGGIAEKAIATGRRNTEAGNDTQTLTMDIGGISNR